MNLFDRQIDKRIAAYQRELIQTHFAEVENMYKQIRGCLLYTSDAADEL